MLITQITNALRECIVQTELNMQLSTNVHAERTVIKLNLKIKRTVHLALVVITVTRRGRQSSRNSAVQVRLFYHKGFYCLFLPMQVLIELISN